MELDSGSWEQRYVYSAFEVDVGNGRATLHREQSMVLGKLMRGANLAVSAHKLREKLHYRRLYRIEFTRHGCHHRSDDRTDGRDTP
ncbi:hypothetical protein [Brucella pituitosa]|uniref:hypothetical protein n=1 Tax=Brucella pituitosa TaxID=571256 RepID=UPI001FE6DC1E|nr:hypothetical protein [Brucella pituitosa]